EDAAEPPGPLRPLPVGRALLARGQRRHDLLVGEDLLRPPEEVRDGEREVLHEALHGGGSGTAVGGRWPANLTPGSVVRGQSSRRRCDQCRGLAFRTRTSAPATLENLSSEHDGDAEQGPDTLAET